MRSGPATRTAFCQREFHVYPLTPQRACPIRARHQLRSRRRLTTLFEANSELRSACAPEDAPRPIASAGCSPAMRDRSLRRPQRPGRPQRFHVREPLGSASFRLFIRIRLFSLLRFWPLGKLPQNRLSQITGSVSFTLAVIALSRIHSRSAIRIRRLTVRKLWTLKLPCGRRRKKR